MTKQKYTIEWDYFDSLQEGLHNAFDERYNLYMLFLKKEGRAAKKQEPELMYIGMTTTTVGDRLLSKHDAFKTLLRDFDAQPISIALGRIKQEGISISDFRNVDSENIEDVEFSKDFIKSTAEYVEYHLIAKFKPKLNGTGVKNAPKLAEGIIITSKCRDNPEWESLNWRS